MSIADNLAIASLERSRVGPFIDRAKEREAVERRASRGCRSRSARRTIAVSTLSGGNQQKVVIAKWLMTEPRIILLNDPTRGIDVGTKQELYRLLRELADARRGILFYSTDYDELIGCCDRVAVMYDGAHRARARGRRASPRRTSSPAPSTSTTGEPAQRDARSRRPAHRLDDRRASGCAQNMRLRSPPSCCSASSTSSTTLDASEGLLRRSPGAERQRGLRARPGRHGADRAGADGGPRSLGRRGDDAGRLHREPSRRPGIARREIVLRRSSSASLAGRARCGFVNGCVVVYGRIQPIIATLATGAIYIGIALFLRPTPGGKVDEDLNWALTNALGDFAATVRLFDDGAAPGCAVRLACRCRSSCWS